MANVLHLFRAPRKRAPMEELLEAHVVEQSGLEGCAHARPNGKRQVLLVDVETLRAMDLQPGIIRENITTEGLDVNALKAGQRLTAGGAELEVSAVCEPCELMEEIHAGLMEELAGRRGMLCRVSRRLGETGRCDRGGERAQFGFGLRLRVGASGGWSLSWSLV